ncbi:hypothetical protein ACFSKI_05000 [Pseudogracilibacillus auburnensis]|uniref:hypothetical protein n=1 Tax=Pseudogracilibacillus auburnensis TaxID=1494959 RepID=UPI0036357082
MPPLPSMLCSQESRDFSHERFKRENVFYAFIDDVTEPVEILVDENGIAKALSIFHRIVPKKSL